MWIHASGHVEWKVGYIEKVNQFLCIFCSPCHSRMIVCLPWLMIFQLINLPPGVALNGRNNSSSLNNICSSNYQSYNSPQFFAVSRQVGQVPYKLISMQIGSSSYWWQWRQQKLHKWLREDIHITNCTLLPTEASLLATKGCKSPLSVVNAWSTKSSN